MCRDELSPARGKRGVCQRTCPQHTRPAYLCARGGRTSRGAAHAGAEGEAAGGAHRAGREACARGGGVRRLGAARRGVRGGLIMCGARACLPSLCAPADAAPLLQSCCAKRSDAKQISTRQISKTPAGTNAPVLNLTKAENGAERTVAEKVGIGAYFQRSVADNGGELPRSASAVPMLTVSRRICCPQRELGVYFNVMGTIRKNVLVYASAVLVYSVVPSDKEIHVYVCMYAVRLPGMEIHILFSFLGASAVRSCPVETETHTGLRVFRIHLYMYGYTHAGLRSKLRAVCMCSCAACLLSRP